MTRALVIGFSLAASVATAQPSDPEAHPVDHLAKAREFHDRGDFVHAREELLAAYDQAPAPKLLFALGQIEFNLHHYQEAIDYYERFNATSPTAEQAALAQQAIGAARIELNRPPQPPAPKPLPPHREWDRVDTGLVVLSGIAALAGGGLITYSEHLDHDHSGTLSTYDARLARARTSRLAAGGCFAAGALAVGAALLHWRLVLVETTVDIHATADGAAITFERALH